MINEKNKLDIYKNNLLKSIAHFCYEEQENKEFEAQLGKPKTCINDIRECLGNEVYTNFHILMIYCVKHNIRTENFYYLIDYSLRIVTILRKEQINLKIDKCTLEAV